MTKHSDIQSLLDQLGEAHRNGAFSSQSPRYPWQTETPEASSLPRHRFGWVRVAVSLAAAAAVAVLFVVPSLSNSPSVTNTDVTRIAAGVPTDVSSELLSSDSIVVADAGDDGCDYNGDGVVNGKDIAAFMVRIQEGDEDVQSKTERLSECLLRL